MQHTLGWTYAQTGITSTTYQLKYLGDELDFADAARTQFDVIEAVTPQYLQANLRVQFAHGFERAKIEVFAKYKRLGKLQQLGSCSAQSRRYNTCFYPCVTFPFTSLRHQILFQRSEAHGQSAAVAIGAQAHIHTEDIAIGGDVVYQRDNLASHAVKEIAIANAACAIGIAVFRVHKNQVYIGRHIQLAPTQLAHAYHQQLL